MRVGRSWLLQCLEGLCRVGWWLLVSWRGSLGHEMRHRPLLERIRVNLLQICQGLRRMLTVQDLHASTLRLSRSDRLLILLLNSGHNLLSINLTQALRTAHLRRLLSLELVQVIRRRYGSRRLLLGRHLHTAHLLDSV